MLELVPLRGEKLSSHAHKTVFLYLLGVLFKICDKHPCLFYMGPLPGGKYFVVNVLYAFLISVPSDATR